MLHKLLLVLSLVFAGALLPAQPPPPTPPPSPVLEPPPFLDEPDHWQIHDEIGSTSMKIVAEYVGTNDVGVDVYDLTITGTDRNGNPISSWAVAYDWNNGEDIMVYNGDSELWTTWAWRGDHYEKLGGTAAKRRYRPVF